MQKRWWKLKVLTKLARTSLIWNSPFLKPLSTKRRAFLIKYDHIFIQYVYFVLDFFALFSRSLLGSVENSTSFPCPCGLTLGAMRPLPVFLLISFTSKYMMTDDLLYITGVIECVFVLRNIRIFFPGRLYCSPCISAIAFFHGPWIMIMTIIN